MEYQRPFSKEWLLELIFRSEQYYLKKYVRLMREEEYYSSIRPCKLCKFAVVFQRNRLGARLGFFIPAGCFGPDLRIWHYGSIIVHPEARIGAGCDIHGNCCIGNNAKTGSGAPVIGKNVNIGQFAQVIGPISVADGVTIGAGAVVVKDVKEEGSVVVGVPARSVKE